MTRLVAGGKDDSASAKSIDRLIGASPIWVSSLHVETYTWRADVTCHVFRPSTSADNVFIIYILRINYY